MRNNGRPVLLVSSLAPQLVDLDPSKPPSMVCQDCRRWQLIRSPMHVHKPNGRKACPGSGQRVHIDVTPEEWWADLQEAVDKTALRRRADGHVPQPPMFWESENA